MGVSRIRSSPWSQSLKDQGKSRTKARVDREIELERRNPLKIRASLGHKALLETHPDGCRNPLKIRASLGRVAMADLIARGVVAIP